MASLMWGVHGRVPVRQGRPVVVATDAAVNPHSGCYAMAYIATTGKFGALGRRLDGRDGNDPVTVSELRAVRQAIENVKGPVTILIDSKPAISKLRDWQLGYDFLPAGYSEEPEDDSPRSLVKLRTKVQANPEKYAFEWVASHKGHPLNEWADSAAKLALRSVGKSSRAVGSPVSVLEISAANRLADFDTWESPA